MNQGLGWERALIGTVLWVKSTNEFRTLVEA
jgi:hypothetical protein